ncbi:MAG: zinc ribbon domain-containing protein, partial [Deltaproteobacteria bacterium]
MAIWCPECGRKNDDAQRECVACGESLALPEEVVDMKVYPVDAPRALQDEKTIKATTLPSNEEKTHLIPRKARSDEERTEILPAGRRRRTLPEQRGDAPQSDPLSGSPRTGAEGSTVSGASPTPHTRETPEKREAPQVRPDSPDPSNPLLPRNLYPPSGQEAFPS